MPRKRFGQHFLSDPAILERLLDFSRVGDTDTVVEIGPGRGSLTRPLARRVARVIAIELDRDLVGPLRQTVPSNVEILEGDALETDFSSLSDEPYAIVANLPYNVSTPLIHCFVGARRHISAVTVLLQQEVADRIVSPPGVKAYGPLSVGVQFYAIPERGFLVRPGAFHPPPKVSSRVLRLTWKEGIENSPDFLNFVRRVFGSRRKTLVNNLAPLPPQRPRAELERLLGGLGIRPGTRAEELSVDRLHALWRALGEPGHTRPDPLIR